MDCDRSSDVSDSKPVCRICYSDEDESEGKLICPCECRGSIGFVHNYCIQRWAKIASINTSDSMESLRCELCHAVFMKKRQLESLRNIVRNLYMNFKCHLESHFETIIILAYVGFLAYRGINDARLRYHPCKKK
mmetsp:Transcript_9105/g.10274  ORF Transcript_9105/g.10274 Transcript_9105/m.10274 type:complete len:134 (-) Transcript_9105:213-614(-)